MTFIGVPGLSDSQEAKESFLNSTGANTFPTLIEGDSIWKRFDVTSQGTFVFLDEDGTFTTAQHSADLLDNVERLIAG